MVNDNRPIADCEKTSQLIGFTDILPIISSPLDQAKPNVIFLPELQQNILPQSK